jgi:hypothetical protein
MITMFRYAMSVVVVNCVYLKCGANDENKSTTDHVEIDSIRILGLLLLYLKKIQQYLHAL